MFEMFGVEFDASLVWLGLGALLLLLEVSTGTLWLLWPGLGAIIFAGVAWASPEMGVGLQLLIFAAISGGLTLLGQRYLVDHVRNLQTDRPKLNDRAAQMIGRRVTAAGPFENGYGAVRLNDGQWRARLEEGDGAALKEGDPLIIRAVEGSMLLVARA